MENFGNFAADCQGIDDFFNDAPVAPSIVRSERIKAEAPLPTVNMRKRK